MESPSLLVAALLLNSGFRRATHKGDLAALERAGFYGVSIPKKTLWREVTGTRFYSVTTELSGLASSHHCRRLILASILTSCRRYKQVPSTSSQT
jgi:hypothetical protein